MVKSCISVTLWHVHKAKSSFMYLVRQRGTYTVRKPILHIFPKLETGDHRGAILNLLSLLSTAWHGNGMTFCCYESLAKL